MIGHTRCANQKHELQLLGAQEVKTQEILQVERAGFESPHFCYPCARQRDAIKSFRSKSLTQSRCSPLSPDIAFCEGLKQGQKRDNSIRSILAPPTTYSP